jgi:acetyl-CoA carboxylase biotin carboxyl carrier protein
VELKDIKAIIDLMKKNSISEFELERQEFKIKLKRGGLAGGEDAPAPVYIPQVAALPVPVAPAAAAPVSAAVPVAPPPSSDIEIKSPMIGTFYRSPSPEAGSYVEVGTEVTPDTVVCIIEAMKVMNEIKAEVKGVITQIVVDNAKPVEFGQPMFKVRPT